MGRSGSCFRRRSPYPLLWVEPMDLRLLLITVDLWLKPEATKWVRSSGSLLFLGRPDGKSFRDIFVFFSLSRFVLWGGLRTISQTREAHNPAKPTNSWGALRTMIQLGGTLCGPSHRSLHSCSLCLPGGALCGPSTKRAKRTNRRSRHSHGALRGP